MESTNPYQSPRPELPGFTSASASVDVAPGMSFAVRTSLWLAAGGFVSLLLALAAVVLAEPAEDSAAENLLGVLLPAGLFGGFLAPVVGMFVLLAAPKGHYRLALVLNGVVLALAGALVLIPLTFQR